jgi:hypothetical protein
MGDVKNKRINIYIDQQAADVALVKLQVQADKLNKSIAAGQASGKSMVAELKKLDSVNSSIKSVTDQLDKGLKPSLAQQTTLVIQLRNELKRLSESDPSFTAKLKNFQQQNAELQRMQEKIGIVTEKTKVWGTSFEKIFTRVVEYAAAYFAFNKVIDFLRGTIEEAKQSEQALTRLKNILDNVGRIDAFDRITQQADELAKKFRFIDNDSIIEVFQKLITYGKLTEKQMDELLPVIINFAAKSGISVEDSSSVIIKALEGNAKALKEYGIQIKDGNDVTERMSILMQELAPRVDGAAESFGNTFSGKVAIASQHIKDLQEDIGKKFLPVLEHMLDLVDRALTGIQRVASASRNGFNNIFATFTIDRANESREKQADAAAQEIVSKIGPAATYSQTQRAYINAQQRIAELNGQLADTFHKFNDETSWNDQKRELQQRIVDMQETIEVWKKVAEKFKSQFSNFKKDNSVLGIDDKDKPGKASPAASISKSVKSDEDQAAEDLLAFQKNLIAKYSQFLRDEIKVKDWIDQINSQVKDNPIEVPVLPADAGDEKLPKEWQDYFKNLSFEGAKLTTEELAQRLNEGLQYASQITDIFSIIAYARIDKDNIALQKELSNNDKRKKSIELLYHSGKLSRASYEKELAAIDADSEKRRKVAAQNEFERTKKVQVAQAVINGAMGVTAVLAAKPGATDILSLAAFRAINIAITLATTAAQIGAIAAQKPKFAKGGALTGPSHNEGGMPIINPRTGHKEAEVEGGEYILSKSTVRNNRGLADALLFSSLHMNGAPVYQTRNYRPVDYAGITKTYNHLRFASGGVMPSSTTNTATGVNFGEDIRVVLTALLEKLSTDQNTVVIQNNISLKQLRDAQDQQTRILANANFKG